MLQRGDQRPSDRTNKVHQKQLRDPGRFAYGYTMETSHYLGSFMQMKSDPKGPMSINLAKKKPYLLMRQKI